IREQCNSVAQHLLHDSSTHGNRPVFSVRAIEAEHKTCFKRFLVDQKNRATLRGNNLEEQLEQTLQQIVETTNRVDRGADFHQRAQIAPHQVDRVVEADLHRRTADHFCLHDPDVARLRHSLALMCEKEKMRVADAHTIAVLEQATANGHVVYKRSVKTLEIRDDETTFLLFDLGMTA